MFSVIFSYEKNRNIFGYNNKLPWHIPEDLKYFKNITKDGILIVGSKTWNNMEEKSRSSILKDRAVIVLTTNMDKVKNENKSFYLFYSHSFDKALELAQDLDKKKEIFVIGGLQVLKQAFEKISNLEKLYITQIDIPKDILIYGDCYFNQTDITNYNLISEELKNVNCCIVNGKNYKCILENRVYVKQNTEEIKYLNLMKKIIEEGKLRNNRTEIPTYSIFHAELEFDISNSIPLMTTKKMYFQGIVEELLWFLRGETNCQSLKDRKVSIWNKNTSREFLDSLGFNNYPEGELGPGYPFLWRHFGEQYIPSKGSFDDYKGYDQIQEVINLIKKDPYSRRMLVVAWDPTKLKQVALPPCHFYFEFYIEDGYLSCKFGMRSSDVFLACCWNTIFYTVLTYMIAHICKLKPGKIVYSGCNVHIYENHKKLVLEQLQRSCRPFPKLIIKKEHETIDSFTYDSFELLDYNYHPRLKGEMAI